MEAHAEVPIKVNAWVDQGVAPLVAALNEFQQVWTLGSCENEPSCQLAPYPAYVLFSYRGSSHEIALFGAMLMDRLSGEICLQSRFRTSLRLSERPANLLVALLAEHFAVEKRVATP